jgi:hypothetical protein
LQPAIDYAAHGGQQMRLFAVGFKQRGLGEIVHFGPDPRRFQEWFLLGRADCCKARDPDFWVEALKGSNGRPVISCDRHSEGDTAHGAMYLARIIVLYCPFEQSGTNASAAKNLR